MIDNESLNKLYYMYQCIKHQTLTPNFANVTLYFRMIEIIEKAPDSIFNILLSDYLEMSLFVMLDPTIIKNDRYNKLIERHISSDDNIIIQIAKAWRTLDVNIIATLFAEHWEKISCDIDVAYWDYYQNRQIIIDAIQIVENNNTTVKKVYSISMQNFLVNNFDILENINILRRMPYDQLSFYRYLFGMRYNLHQYFDPTRHERYEQYFIILQCGLENLDERRMRTLKIIEWFNNTDHRPLKMSRKAIEAFDMYCAHYNITIQLRILHDLYASNYLNINIICVSFRCPFIDTIQYCNKHNLEIDFTEGAKFGWWNIDKIIDLNLLTPAMFNGILDKTGNLIEYVWKDIAQNKTQSPYFDETCKYLRQWDSSIPRSLHSMDSELFLELDKRNCIGEYFVSRMETNDIRNAPLSLQYKWLKKEYIEYYRTDIKNLSAVYNDLKIICQKFEETDQCPICYNPIEKEMAGLQCNPAKHYMCNTCYVSYTATTCHICRAPYDKYNIYKIIKID